MDSFPITFVHPFTGNRNLIDTSANQLPNDVQTKADTFSLTL